MTFELLPVMRENAVEDLHECLPQVARGALSVDQLAVACSLARRAGILTLFVDGDPNGLHQHLAASGQMFLQGTRAIGDDALVASRCLPLIDAIAARADDVAMTIAGTVLRLPHRAKQERVEDHAWFQFLGVAADANATDRQLQKPLESASRALGDAPAPRIDAGRALVARDRGAFDAALARLADRHRERWEMRFAKGAVGEDEFAAEGHLFVEGLALLALADRRGLATEFEHSCLPDEARRRSLLTVDAEAWRTITS